MRRRIAALLVGDPAGMLSVYIGGFRKIAVSVTPFEVQKYNQLLIASVIIGH
jgi:hypothetical protein